MNNLQLLFLLMQKSVKVSLVVASVVLLSIISWNNTTQIHTGTTRLLPAISYQTSTTRTSTVDKNCISMGGDRSTLVSDSEAAAAVSNRAAVDKALGIDGNDLIKKATSDGFGTVITTITGSIQAFVIFLGFFILGFFILFIIWPFLCCCCCCPSCCPSKCCQKDETQQYSKCQLYWPATVLIIALLLTISASIYGFIGGSKVSSSINSLSCSAAILTDDILNGNTTMAQDTYFLGLNSFKIQLANLGTQVGVIDGHMSNLQSSTAGSDMQNAVDSCDTAFNNVKVIPTTAGPNGPITATYNAPINSGTPVTSTPFPFSTTLGAFNVAGTLVQGMYSAVDKIKTFLISMRTKATNFHTQTGTISSSVGGIQTTIQGLIDSMNKFDDTLNNMLSFMAAPSSYGSMAVQAFYGVMIGFSSLTLLGTILTVCCGKFSCRNLMYLGCIFLFIAALIGFIIAIVLSILVPVFSWTCSYLDVTLQDSASFNTNMGSFLDASTLAKIQVCMPFGDGDLVSQVGSGAVNGIKNLTSVLDQMNAYDPTVYIDYLSGNLTKAVNTIQGVVEGKIPNLDASDVTILNQLSSPSHYTGCSNAAFLADSWIPSIAQDTSYPTISCKATNGKTGTQTSCGGGALPAVPTATCAGCMDTFSILGYYTGLSTSPAGDLTSRYSCAGFSTDLENIWANYYNVMQPIFSAVHTRAVAAQTQITDNATVTGVYKNIYNINSMFGTIKTNLNAAVQTLTDPTYGMLAGLNCKLFGQDFVRLQKVMCGSVYNNLYTIRLSVGIASFGILFAMCCIVCTGVRHLKHSQRMSRVDQIFYNGKQEPDSTSNFKYPLPPINKK